jgi:hypothetical protein
MVCPGQTCREAGTQSQGCAREGTPPGYRIVGPRTVRGDAFVKANLARFTRAVMLLASLALTLGAGIKWDWW